MPRRKPWRHPDPRRLLDIADISPHRATFSPSSRGDCRDILHFARGALEYAGAANPGLAGHSLTLAHPATGRYRSNYGVGAVFNEPCASGLRDVDVGSLLRLQKERHATGLLPQ